MTVLAAVDNGGGKKARQTAAIIAILLLMGTFALFSRTAGHDFVNIDDDEYVYNNQYVVQGLTIRGITWALTATHAANWHPVTWLSHMLDVQLFGLNPAGHHLMNVAIHGLNVMLLFLLLRRLTGTLWRSAAVAALFAVHPLHVESVAWVAERKDLLSTLMALATISFYSSYARTGRQASYLAACSCYLLGLMAKPMLVTLPLLLLILDYWPLERVRPGSRELLKLLREKIPLLAAMLCSMAITLYAQTQGGAVNALTDTPLAARLANALVSYLQYLVKTVLPMDLAVFYPFTEHIPPWQPLLALVLLSLATRAAVHCRQRRPWLLTGWLWYLCSLLPVIGIVKVGSQAMADRYTYLPLIGFFIVVVWLGAELLPRRGCYRQFAALAVITACSVSAWWQLGYWRNSITLNRRALAVTGDNFIARNNLGAALESAGAYEEALLHFREAARIAPWFAKAHVNMAEVMRKTGRVDEGLAMVRTALRIHPDYPLALDEYGALLLQSGRPDEALAVYRELLRTDPGSAEILHKLGTAASRQEDRTAAIGYFHRSLAINPVNSDCLFSLAKELDAAGEQDAAAPLFAASLSNAPRPAMIHTKLAVHRRQQGKLTAAEASLQAALRLEPGLAAARSELATVMLLQKRPEDAITQLREALRLAPAMPDYHYNMGLLLADMGDHTTALGHLRSAVRLKPEEVDYRFYLGMELLHHGLASEAAAEFTEVIRLKPHGAPAKLAQEKLAHAGRRQ